MSNDSSQLLQDLFQAYYDARKNKRLTANALAFEIDYEKKLFELCKEIESRNYKISRSICFMSFNPARREIFAADFRDRVVHHLVYNYISPLFERLFISDSYSCRLCRGTSYGIKRLDHFIRSCSENYKHNCYILKFDIKGYFMSINHLILYQKVRETLKRFRNKVEFDMELVLYLIDKVIFYDPAKYCRVKGKRKDWQGFPRSKSLFYSGTNKGLAIGNLTSQLFGNVYMNDFDHFVKHKLRCKYYGRYVDDGVIVHSDKEYLKSIISVMREFLQTHFLLELHPKKIYLQHFSKGVDFLGVVIKPYRIYIRNRIKGNFYKTIQYWNNILLQQQKGQGGGLTRKQFEKFLSCMNSYLGIMQHYNTYKLRKKMLASLSPYFWEYVYAENAYNKLVLKNKNN